MAAGGIVSQGITVKFAADTSKLTSGVSEAQGILGGFSGIASTSLLAVGAAAVAGGVAAVKMAGDFQAGMTTLVTGAGEASNNIKLVSDGILKMAVDTGTTSKQLTDGMYMIESAGFHGAEGLNVLKAAAEGAKVGNADLAYVANGVTTALTDYALPASKATEVTNDLIATVASGKTTMQALSTAMSTILPTASSVGVGLTDVSAAMATLTGEGTNAATAATYLKQLLMALENPASKGAAALRSIGLSTKEVSDEMKVSLPGTLQLITDHLKTKFPEGSAAYVGALADISGGSKQMGAMLQLTGSHLTVFKGNVDNIAGAVKKGGDSISGWSDVQNNFNFKMAQAKEVIETFGIAIGTKLLPIVSSVVGAFVSTMQGIGSSVADTGKDIGKIFTYIGNVLKSVDFSDFNNAWTGVNQSVGKLGQTFQKFMGGISPLRTLLENLGSDFDPITGIILNLAAGFNQFGSIIGGSIKTDLDWLGTTFNQIGGWIQSSLMPALATLIPPFQSIATTIITNFLPAFAQIFASGKQLVEAMLTPLIGVLENIIPPVISIAGWLAGGLAAGFQLVAPLVKVLADVISGLVNFFTKTEVGGALVKATLIALAVPVSVLAIGFTALAVEAIAAFIMSIPGMVAGFAAGAAGAWAMAVPVIALTWPILAVIAAIALVVLAIQHWGDIMDWFSGKAEQTRIKTEQEHVKMAISQDTNTAKGAQAAINNMEKERLGIIQKLKETHDETEKAELTHQYNMIAAQEQAQKAKLQKAEEHKKQQIAKQKELHAEMEEAQKPWIVRMGDGIKYGFEAAWHWISDRAIDAWNWIKGVFAPVGGWFNDRWNEIKKWWGEAGQWFQDKFAEAKNGIINAFGPVGQVFQEKWKEISTSANSAWKGIVKFSEDAWKGIVAGVKAGALAFLSALTAPFIAIGQLFVWLYNHNYYVKALVDHIVDFFKGCLDWIKMAWTASINWLVGVWKTIAKFATDLWKQVSSAITGAVKVAWDWLVGVWTTVSTWLVGVWNAIAKFAADLWKQVSSAITGAVKVAWDWLVSVWNTISKWLQDQWNTVAKFATDLWNKIATAVHDGWVKAVGFVSDVWNQIAAFFTNAWNTYISKPLTTLWQNVSNIFSSAWSAYVSKPLSDLWNSISTWFSNLGTHAYNSGTNFIKMLVDGINSGAGSIWNAVVNIANTIWKALGFHSPAKAGPGADADKWMPNLVSMLSSDLLKGVPKMQIAVNAMAQPLTALSGSNVLNASLLQGMNNFKTTQYKYPTGAGQAASSPQIVVHVHPVVQPNDIHIDGHEMANRLAPHIANMIRLKGDVRNR